MEKLANNFFIDEFVIGLQKKLDDFIWNIIKHYFVFVFNVAFLVNLMVATLMC